jgi:hypothetical protein
MWHYLPTCPLNNSNGGGRQRGIEKLLVARSGDVGGTIGHKGFLPRIRSLDPVASRQDLEAGTGLNREEDDEEDSRMRVSASVGWNLQPIEPKSNT